MSLRVVVPPHPLIAHWLTVLRERTTPPPLFATALAELGRWLSYEALRDWLPQRAVTLETALAPCEGQVVDGTAPLLAVLLLPAGLGLWEGARGVLPAAALVPLAPLASQDGPEVASGWSVEGLPELIGERVGVLVFVPELALAEPLLVVLERLRKLGVSGPRLRLISTVAAAPALKILGERQPELTLYCACIDPDLDSEGRMVPGLGPVSRRYSGIDALAAAA